MKSLSKNPRENWGKSLLSSKLEENNSTPKINLHMNAIGSNELP